MIKTVTFLITFFFTSLVFGGTTLLSRRKDRKNVIATHKLQYREYSSLFPFGKYEKKENFEVITPLKSGTHLLEKTLGLISGNLATGSLINYRATGKNPPEKISLEDLNKYYFALDHFYSENKLNYIINSPLKTVSIIRDPRDVLISHCFHYAIHYPDWRSFTIKERALILLEDPLYFGSSSNIAFQLDSLIKLQQSKLNVFTVRFENLVGEKGNGKTLLQKEEVKSLAKFLNIPLNNEQIQFITSNLFGGSWGTFRKGQIGGWKQYFDDDLKAIFKEKYNTYLIQFGYEKDDKW